MGVLGAWVPAMILAVALLASVAAGTPPCPAFDYRVAYAAPVCSAYLLRQPHIPLQNLFWLNWSSWEYVSFADLIRPAPSAAQRVTFLDANGDRNASTGDAFQYWMEGSCSGVLEVYFGANATSIGGYQGIVLRDGFVQDCMASSPNPDLAILAVGLGTAGLATVGGLIAYYLVRRK